MKNCIARSNMPNEEMTDIDEIARQQEQEESDTEEETSDEEGASGSEEEVSDSENEETENEEVEENVEAEEGDDGEDSEDVQVEVIGQDEDVAKQEGGTEVIEGSEEQEAQTRVSRIRDITDKIKDSVFQLSKEVFYVKKRNLWPYVTNPSTGEVYTNFQEFVKNELPYSPRKVAYLSNCWDYYVNEIGEGDPDIYQLLLNKLGISKVIELKDYVTEDNLNKWIEIASERSVRELKDYISEMESDDDDDEEDAGGDPGPEELETKKGTQINLEVDESENDIIQEGLRIAQNQTGNKNKGTLFAHIFSDWVAMQSGEGSKNLRQYFKQIQKSVGVNLVGIDFDGNPSIVFGEDNLDKLTQAVQQAEEEAVENF
jgi:hypothetical protein